MSDENQLYLIDLIPQKFYTRHGILNNFGLYIKTDFHCYNFGMAKNSFKMFQFPI